MRRVQPIVDAIDTHIKALRKEVADLEGHRKRLLSNIGGSSHFGDQPLSFLFLFFFLFAVVVVVFLFLLPLLVHFMFPIALIWKVLPQFGFVTMMLHFNTAFAIAMI